MPTHFSSTCMRLKVASTGKGRPAPCAPRQLVDAAGLRKSLERAALLVRQQRRSGPPITSCAGTPKIRSAARL